MKQVMSCMWSSLLSVSLSVGQLPLHIRHHHHTKTSATTPKEQQTTNNKYIHYDAEMNKDSQRYNVHKQCL
ncbi:hypothetical protein E2C01_064832 [Portunus trituberculatus]|uniref:Uncharacterized protein n=1 Tax=Portunus trituberculatus TaxID=210409 RepID=A0A5B7HE41_PORTR|nr:hypothetical protein [Portunus trituberculatus]